MDMQRQQEVSWMNTSRLREETTILKNIKKREIIEMKKKDQQTAGGGAGNKVQTGTTTCRVRESVHHSAAAAGNAIFKPTPRLHIGYEKRRRRSREPIK